MTTTLDPSKNFNIEDPVSTPLILVPQDVKVNWETEPMSPPNADYKRDINDIGDNEAGVTSDWNFVLPDNF